MRRSWQMTSAFSRAGRSGGSQALQLPRVSLSRGSPPYFLCSRSRPAEVGIFLHGIASLHRRGREHITHIGLRRICNGWNPSIKERVKFIFSHARGNNYRFCRRFHAIAKSNRVFFIIYRYWLRLESVVILGFPLIFLGFALLLLLKLVA